MATLTSTELTKSYYLQKALFADSTRKGDYIAETNAAKAILANQTAQIKDLADKDKKRQVRVYWSKFCNDDVETGTPDFCDFEGAEADSDYKDYTLSQYRSKSFTLDEKNYENNFLSPAEVFADNMLKTKKWLDESITKAIISSVDGFSSPNLHQEKPGCAGVVSPESWAQTYIPPGMWTPELMRYLQNVARINKFGAPFLLDGSNLDATAWKAIMNAANANGAGADKMMKLLPYYEDLVNMEEVSPGKTFLIEKGTVAFVSRALWSGSNATNPIEEKARKKYSEPSDNIPGLIYDVYIKETCSDEFLKHDVLVVANFGTFNAPANCNSGTGVLEFVCGACPS